MATDYLAAESTLILAETSALAAEDWDTLARLYMPLQETRRQRRQRCGEGVVQLDLISHGPDDTPLDPEAIVHAHSHGQLLIAAWGSIAPAAQVRKIQATRRLYVETFLAAAYPMGHDRAVVIVPTEDVKLPPADAADGSIDKLVRLLPPGCLVLSATELPSGPILGTPATYARVMDLWERLHAPFLAAADAEPNPRRKIEAYRQTITIDYACELAHQRLSETALQLARRSK
jgi:hypothetical protein